MKQILTMMVVALTMAVSGFAKGNAVSCDPRKASLSAPTDLAVVATDTTIDVSWIGPEGATKWSVEVIVHYLVSPDTHLSFGTFPPPELHIPLVELESETGEPAISVEVRVKGLNPPTKGKDTSQCNPFTDWVSTETACETTDYYPDADGDGYGDMTASPTSACEQPEGYVTDNTDCNDAVGVVNPGAEEVCDCSSVDEDCNPDTTIEGVCCECQSYDSYQDSDDDGYGNPAVPGTAVCGIEPGYVLDNTDCNDSDININPGATEVCDGVDNNCINGVDEGGVCAP